MSSPGSTVPESGSRLRTAAVWGTPLVVLAGVWLWTAFSSGGFLARQWLVPSLALGFCGLVVSFLVAYPRRPRQLSFVVLALFGSYSLWVASSALWAASTTRVWLESGRTFTYLIILTLAAIYLTDKGARKVFRYLLIASALALLVTCISKLWSTADVASLFFANRLSYPVTYPNNAAALFLIAFWPLVWLAAGPEEKAPVRGIALGLATGLLGLAFMTQSRGAVWSLAITAVVMFVLSPARLRTLLHLLVPALLMVYGFPQLNRYWQDGAQTVGGALGARTLVMMSITAAFIGMILALLERWVKVSRRMKAVFGSVVLLGVVAAAVYGSVVVTSDEGGPLKWLSQTWRQFTEQSVGGGPGSETQSGSRFTEVSANGRVDIWRVAWKEFNAEPILGVGADNFVYRYDELRSSEGSKPKHPHSLFLQVLAETGIVGGILFVAGLLVAAGGILWPRCAAGWRRARETWLKSERPVSSHACHPRWGADPQAYGWEMALLVALIYWLIHGSVEWLWQMSAVSIPAFLLLAAGLAEVDARADTMWPRWSRWLRTTPSEPVEESSQPQAAAEPVSAPLATGGERSVARGRTSAGLMQPPGPLSLGFRLSLLALSLLIIVAAGLPYLALRFEESALALARTDARRAIERAGAAHWLQLADPSPFLTQATIYENAAKAVMDSDRADRRGAALDDLALAVVAHNRALDREPADWSLHYRAAIAVLNLVLATEYSEGRAVNLDIPSLIPSVPGLADWSALAPHAGEGLEPGEGEESTAGDETAHETARGYRNMSQGDLLEATLAYLEAAEERNPLASQIGEAVAVVERIAGP